jgi:hypothetical protein
VILRGDNIYTIKKNTGTLIGASKEVDLEISVEKTKYMLRTDRLKMCHSSNIWERHDQIEILFKRKLRGD